MSTSNFIKKAIPCGTALLKSGLKINLNVATKTAQWDRPEHMVKPLGIAFKEAVEQSDEPLPKGTVTATMREGPHKELEIHKTHYTAVAVDANGLYIETFHVSVPKKEDEEDVSNTS